MIDCKLKEDGSNNKDKINSHNQVLVYDILDTPVGEIYIVMDDYGLRKIEILKTQWDKFLNLNTKIRRDSDRCQKVKTQIMEYFNGTRKEFDINLSLRSTPFRMRVWDELMKIPYGETRSYADVAKNIGNIKAVRAIGQANKINPIPIIIPCHRVVGKNGNIRGYIGSNGHIQKILLDHENTHK